LHDLQLGKVERRVADSVGWHLEAVLDERDAPACQDGDDERTRAEVFQVRVPGKGHEDIRGDEKEDRFDQDRHRGAWIARRIRAGGEASEFLRDAEGWAGFV